MIKVLQGAASRRAGHLHHRPGGRRCCWPTSAPMSSRSSSPAPAIRSAPSRAASTARTSRPTTATSAASPRHQVGRRSRALDQLVARCRRLHPELPPRRRREARRRRGAAARAQPAPRLLRDQRLRRDGPAAHRPSYDTVAQAASGYLSLLVNPGNPRVVGPAIADAVTGFYAAYGVLGALFERSRTGVGRKVEVSMLEAMAHFNLDAFTHFYSVGEVMGPYSRPSVSQSYVLRVRRRQVDRAAHVSPEKFWQGLADAIERPRHVRGPALCHPRSAHRQPGGADRGAGRRLRAAAARRVVPAPGGAATCRTRRCTTPARRLDDPQAQAPACSSIGDASGDGALSHRALAGLVRRPARAGCGPPPPWASTTTRVRPKSARG